MATTMNLAETEKVKKYFYIWIVKSNSRTWKVQVQSLHSNQLRQYRYLEYVYSLNLIKFHSTTWTNATLYLLPSETIRIIFVEAIGASSPSPASSPWTVVVHIHLDYGGGGGWRGGEVLGGGWEMLRRTACI